jgi:DNA-binding transcriptional ArsR family regulator
VPRLFEELADLDRTLHEPARLAIVTGLSAFESSDFLSLQKLTGLTPGNLSVHLTKLEQAGLVTIEKSFQGRKPRTTVRLTRDGHAAVEGYWQRMDSLRRQAHRWRANGSPRVPDRSARKGARWRGGRS